MSFDNLVDAAESRGGMASQSINLPRVFVNRKTEKSDHRLLNKPTFKDHPAGPSLLAKYIPPIELVDLPPEKYAIEKLVFLT